MTSTRWAMLAVAAMTVSSAHPGAQQSGNERQPSFRSGVELVSVEVGVVDKQGRPVRDLGPADFAVTVAGQPRRVVTAEFIESGAQGQQRAVTDDVPISTNEGGGVGRLFVFVIDGTTLEIGDARQVAQATGPFFSRLTPADRSALISLPIGRSIAFTWSHDRVRDALLHASTTGAMSIAWEFGSLTEARDIASRGAFALREVASRECSGSALANGFSMEPPAMAGSNSGQSSPPTGSAGGGSGEGSSTGSSGSQGSSRSQPSPQADFAADRCLREIQSQAEMTWNMARANSLASLTALRQVFATLARVQGDKNVVLISGGWPLEDHDQNSMVNALAADAAAARATLFTLYVPRQVMSASRRSISPMFRSDQTLFLWPLENLAAMTGGRSYRADVGAEGIFERISRELSGYYRIGVERDPVDANATGRRMKVRVARDGATVRAREIFDVVTYEDRDWSARLASALESPTPATAVGLRVTSYVAADPDDPSFVRIVLAGDASRVQPGDATLRLIVRSVEGERVTAGEQRMGELPAGTSTFVTNVRVPPGSYVIRLALQDGAGRVGSVDHRVEARPVSVGTLAVTGPMLVQVGAAGQGNPHFTVDGVRPDERLALEVGLEGDTRHLANADVTFEVASGSDGPALIRQPANLSSRRDGSIVAQAMADVRLLPPGQYIARARITSGDQPLGEVRRAFAVIGRPAPAMDDPAAGAYAVGTAASISSVSVRGRAAHAIPPFAAGNMLSRQILDPFLERVAARPDAAFPGIGELIARARTEGVAALSVSEAQAAQTPVAAFVRGLTLLAQNKLNPAATAFRAAMRASPDFYPAMVYLGACYAAAGNDKEAAAVWRTALIKEGATPTLHLMLADAFLRQGDGNAALQVVSAARSRWPEEDELARRFVLASMLAGNVASGLQTLDDLVQRGADDEPSLALALWVLYDALTNGRTIDGADQDRARLIRLADAYRTRGGPSLALVETWVAAVKVGDSRTRK